MLLVTSSNKLVALSISCRAIFLSSAIKPHFNATGTKFSPRDLLLQKYVSYLSFCPSIL
jgi:hypothetical protein